MKLFVELDISLNKTAVCIMDDAGKTAFEGTVLSDPEALVTKIGKWRDDIELIGLEACPLSEGPDDDPVSTDLHGTSGKSDDEIGAGNTPDRTSLPHQRKEEGQQSIANRQPDCKPQHRAGLPGAKPIDDGVARNADTSSQGKGGCLLLPKWNPTARIGKKPVQFLPDFRRLNRRLNQFFSLRCLAKSLI